MVHAKKAADATANDESGWWMADALANNEDAQSFNRTMRALSLNGAETFAARGEDAKYGARAVRMSPRGKRGLQLYRTREKDLVRNANTAQLSLESLKHGVSYTRADGKTERVKPTDRAIEYILGTPGKRGALRQMQATAEHMLDNEVQAVNERILNIQNQHGLSNAETNLRLNVAQELAAELYQDSAKKQPGTESTPFSRRTVRAKLNELPDPERVVVAEMMELEARTRRANRAYREAVLGRYVPVSREGAMQVSVGLADTSGRPLSSEQIQSLPDELRRMLPYFRAKNERDAKLIQKRLQEAFEALGDVDIEDGPLVFRFEARVSAAGAQQTQTPTMSSIQLRQMLDTIELRGAGVPQEARNALAQAMDQQERSTLAPRPGADKQLAHTIAQWIYGTNDRASRTLHAPRVHGLLTAPMGAWTGENDLELPNRVAAKFDEAQAEGDLAGMEKARREWDATVYKMEWMLPERPGGYSYTLAGKTREFQGRGEGERMRDEVIRNVEWINQPGSLDHADDWLERGAVGQAKQLAMLSMLGANLATAGLNVTSVFMNTMPWLATYNAKNGYGGGFGVGKSGLALSRAMMQMAMPRYGNVKYLTSVVDGKTKDANITPDEARMLRDFHLRGDTTPQMSNNLIGAMLNKGSPRTRKVRDAWMLTFNATESLARRSGALAAYRLNRAKQEGLGDTDTIRIHRDSVKLARDALNFSQGHYERLNRPNFARDGLGSMVFMFKMFVVTSMELMKNMAPKGRVLFLGSLMLASGVEGLPFAQDLFNVIEMLRRAFGIQNRTLQRAMIETFDTVLPGSAPFVMHGGLNWLSGGNVGPRLGFGDLVPGLDELLVSGVDQGGRSIVNFIGPAAAATLGAGKMLAGAAQQGLEATGLKTETTDWQETFIFDNPVSAVRGLLHGMVIMNDGSVRDRHGRIVDADASAKDAVARMLGFTTADSAAQWTMTKLARLEQDHAASMRTEIVREASEYVMRGDRTGLRRLMRDVAAMNRNVIQSGAPRGYLVQNLGPSIRKATQEGLKSVIERQLRDPLDHYDFKRLVNAYGGG